MEYGKEKKKIYYILAKYKPEDYNKKKGRFLINIFKRNDIKIIIKSFKL